MFDVNSKIQKLLETNPDPRQGIMGQWLFNLKEGHNHFPMILGVVTDNKDPDCLGRIRVSMDMIVPGAQTPFLPIAGQWKKKQSGWWVLPEVGTQAVVLFTSYDYSKGFVAGFIYDQKHLPPEHRTKNPSDSTLWQTKNHRLEIIDEDGKEEITMETAEGKMRVILNKEGGIQLINELGDINIKCKNLNVEGEDEIHIKSKSYKLETDDSLKINAKGKIDFNSDKNVTLKGQNIKMSGSKGVTAEKKQIAVEGDKVVGFDTHIMVVPAGTSTANVPLPHPFIGQMKDQLSNNVKIGNKQCATKGSVAKHNDSMHMQLPGTIKFQKNPSKDGKVTNGTSSKVKINGKEAAVIGSQVTTCNDMGMQNNSTIVSIGASIPMPSIINPLNNDEYKDEKDKDKKEPGFETVKWASASTDEGKEVELTASVKDIDDDNMVTLQVFPDGKGPEDGVAIASFPCKVKGGSVSAKWTYKANDKEVPPDDDPKFVFSAHSAWCNFKKSSNTLTVKLVRPEVTKAEWHDEDGNSLSSALVGQNLKLYAEVKNVEDGQGLTFKIMESGKDEPIGILGAEVKDGKAEVDWTYIYKHDEEHPLKEKPKLKLVVTGSRCKEAESQELEISGTVEIYVINDYGEIQTSYDYKFKHLDSGDEKSGKIKDGKIKIEDLIPGLCELTLTKRDEENQESEIEIPEDAILKSININNLDEVIKIDSYNRFLIMINHNIGMISR